MRVGRRREQERREDRAERGQVVQARKEAARAQGGRAGETQGAAGCRHQSLY
jgi:hypothetical protein